MAALVIDPSITLAWVQDTTPIPLPAAFALLQEKGALTPGLWRMELADHLLEAEAAGRLDEAASTRLLARIAELPVTWVSVPTPIPDLMALARRHGLSGRQALYLALALDQGLPLASAVPRLMAAAEKEGLPTL